MLVWVNVATGGSWVLLCSGCNDGLECTVCNVHLCACGWGGPVLYMLPIYRFTHVLVCYGH